MRGRDFSTRLSGLPSPVHLPRSTGLVSMVEVAANVAAATASPKKGTANKKKPKTKATHPPTSEMVNAAIKNLKERGGSSLQAIKKYIASNYKVDVDRNSTFIRKYLKSAVAKGSLIQTKGKGASGSFKIGGASSAAGTGGKAKVVKKKKTQAAKKKKEGGAKKAKKASPAKKTKKAAAGGKERKSKASKKVKAPKPKKATTAPKSKKAAPKKK